MSELDIGGIVRQFRLARGITLQELARRANISQSFLSRVERNRVDPSVKTLIAVAKALGVSASIFLQGPEAKRSERIQFVRRAERSVRYVQDGRIAIHTLARSPDKKATLEVSLHTYQPGAKMPVEPEGTQFAEILLLVQQGQITAWVDNAEYQMTSGDSLCFPGDLPHRWWNSGNDVAVVLVCAARRAAEAHKQEAKPRPNYARA